MRILAVAPALLAALTVLNAYDGPSSPRKAQPAVAASIRVSVNMTLVPVTVLDENGRNVTGLERENFRVVDGPAMMPIASFSRDDQPISVGLVFDCSSSMRDKFVTARQGPMELFKRLNEGDESFLVTVADDAKLRLGMTAQLEEVENALIFTNPHGATALVDGAYLGLAQLKKATHARKALIIVSDGGDNNSRYLLRDVTKVAKESDAQIFTIGIHENPRSQEEADGPRLLQDLSDASGGIYFPVNNVNRLGEVMATIGNTLHNQYVLGFYPPPDAAAGKYRKIKVQLLVPQGLPTLRVFARAGYYAPGN